MRWLLASGRARWFAGCAVLLALYGGLVPPVWRSRSWSDEGMLSLDRPHLDASDRLTPDAVTADDVRQAEHDEYGDCADDTVYLVTGAHLKRGWYYAVFDVVEGDVCDVGLYRADGHDLFDDDDGRELVAVAKEGGIWPDVGTVKSVRELQLGAAFLVVVMLQGLSYYGRWRPPLRPLRPVTLPGATRLLLLGSMGVAGAASAFVVLDVLTLPDGLGALVTGLDAAAASWSFAGGRSLLAPADFGKARPEGVRSGRMFRVRLRKRSAPAEAALPRQEPSSSGTGAKTVGRPPVFTVVSTGDLPHYEDVGGLDGVKAFLDDTLGLLLAFAGEADDYRITFNGILFHGPPGVGKTLLAKAVAGEYGLSFIHVTSADITTGVVGGGARRVREAFRTAAANVPCLLFFDEFDAIARDRGAEPDQESRRTVAQLLSSLEEHRSLSDLIVVAATNDLEGLDAAVVRPGRFDRHIRLDLPDAAGRLAVLRACLHGRPVVEGIDLQQVVRRTEGRSSAALAGVVEAAALAAFRQATRSGKEVRMDVAHLLSALDAMGGRDRPTVENWGWGSLVLPDDVLNELRQLQAVLVDPDAARAYGVRPPSGLLLAGPPGTGKTTIAKVLAAQARCSFYPVTAADLTSKWVGDSEDAVQRLFRRARENAPSIIFLDEIDAVASARGTLADHADRLLTQLLVEIDGLGSTPGVFVLGATNRPEALDPALLRGGRLSRTIMLPMPDRTARRELLRLHSSRMPLEGVDLDTLAQETEGFSGAQLAAVCQQAALTAMARRLGAGDRPCVRLSDFEVALADLRTEVH